MISIHLYSTDANVLFFLPNEIHHLTKAKIWGIINLPIDNYSFLFRVNSPKNVQRSFALDNIAINLCDDPPTELTMCDMINKHDDSSSMFNFTVVTGNREFGSTRDHTSTSSSGSFLY
ncbi:unnamed protein product [Rotaria sp. Silwood1]|nr:unnamed protein product [Rotaria sp. Silwood1]